MNDHLDLGAIDPAADPNWRAIRGSFQLAAQRGLQESRTETRFALGSILAAAVISAILLAVDGAPTPPAHDRLTLVNMPASVYALTANPQPSVADIYFALAGAE